MKRSGFTSDARSRAVSSAVASGDVSRMAAITITIARRAVFSRGGRSAGAIWLIDSRPEYASQEPEKPTSRGQGGSAAADLN